MKCGYEPWGKIGMGGGEGVARVVEDYVRHLCEGRDTATGLSLLSPGPPNTVIKAFKGIKTCLNLR